MSKSLRAKRTNSGGFRTIRFDEIASLNPKISLKKGEVAPFIDMASLPQNARDIVTISQKLFKGSGTKFQNGDTLIARITPCLENGKGALVNCLDDGQIAFGSTEFIVARAILQSDKNFIYYVTRSEFFREIATLQMEGTSGRQRVAWQQIANIEIPNIEPVEREKIGETLSILDDKIKLNREMNETLESVARAIFKDWFVDFGPIRAKMEGREPYLAQDIWDLFPDKLNGDKPTEWREKTLGTLLNVSIGRTPPRKERQHFVPCGHGITWLSIKTMGEIQTFAVSSEEDLSSVSVERFRVPLIPAGTVLVSFKLTVGRVAIAAKDMCSNEAIAHLISKDDTPVSNIFVYCFMKNFDYESLGSTSSIATAVNSKSIKNIKITIPNPSLDAAFTKITKPLFDRILSNVHQNETIIAIRNLLLPKLISGEIRITEAEKAVQEAVASQTLNGKETI